MHLEILRSECYGWLNLILGLLIRVSYGEGLRSAEASKVALRLRTTLSSRQERLRNSVQASQPSGNKV